MKKSTKDTIKFTAWIILAFVGVTKGPWEPSCGRNDFAVVTQAMPYPSEDQVRYGGYPVAECEFNSDAINCDNMEFICGSRSDVPWLLARVRELQAECERLTRHNVALDMAARGCVSGKLSEWPEVWVCRECASPVTNRDAGGGEGNLDQNMGER